MASDVNQSDRESAARIETAGEAFPVLTFDAIVAATQTRARLSLLSVLMGYPSEVFDAAVRPVIRTCAEFVQRLPVAGSMTLDHPGGRFVHALELALRVLSLRRGYALPRAASPEVVGEFAHRWTYAALIAALLHSTTRVATGLRIELIGGAAELGPWIPENGPMSRGQATAYRVRALAALPAECRDERLGRDRLYREWVPAYVREWLDEDPQLAAELGAWLGRDQDETSSVLDELVRGASGSGSSVERADPAVRTEDDEVRSFDLSDSSSAAATVAAVADARAPAHEDSVVVSPTAPDPAVSSRTVVARVFQNWLRLELEAGSIRVNDEGGMVHRVAEGLLLVSPKIFQVFAGVLRTTPGVHGVDIPADAGNPAKWVQREVLRPKWHRCTAGGQALHRYVYRSGRRLGADVFGVIIPDVERFIDTPLAPSDMLERVAEVHAGP
jgi:hypothetical protein